MSSKSKKSTAAWIMEFASTHKSKYVFSMIMAVIGVACSMVPFVIIANMVKRLLEGDRELSGYLLDCGIMLVLWLGRVICHSISTTFSHKATFEVLGNIRKRVCDKLSKLPLGYVLDTPSGSLKNVIVGNYSAPRLGDAMIFGENRENKISVLPLDFCKSG